MANKKTKKVQRVKAGAVTCCGCGKRLVPGLGGTSACLSIHMDQLVSGRLLARTVGEMVRLRRSELQQAVKAASKIGKAPIHLYLQFCSFECLAFGPGITVARRAIIEFAKAHLRSGLRYTSHLHVSGKDPFAFVRILKGG